MSIAAPPPTDPTLGAGHRPPRASPPERDATRTIVVGAGFGGIAAALRLRARGDRVTLIDRLDHLGGRARVFSRNGYTFDAGPTVITAPFLIDELFALFGRRTAEYVTLAPVDPWYRVRFHDDTHFDYTGDRDRTLEQIRAIEPRDADGYLRMLRACDEIYRVGFEKLGDQPFDRPGDMLAALPDMVRLRSFRSVYAFAAAHLRSEKLRRVFSFQPLLVGGNPFKTSSIYALIQSLERRFGVHYAMGGTGALVNALGRLMEEAGIDIRLGETVDRIDTLGGRVAGVTLERGERLPADRVVSNADPAMVYQRLLPAEPRSQRTRNRSRSMKQSMGLFVIYFGARRTYPDLAHHTILLSDRYKELLADIFDRGRLPADPSLYVHAPTRTDPAMAPEGRECFYALAPVPNLKSGAKTGIDWEREGDRFREVVLDRIEKELAPGLRDHIESEFYLTPEYFRDELRSTDGAGFGVQPLLSQSAYLRFHTTCPHYRGLHFVGAGTHPGAGIPGVLTTAKTLERALDRETAR